LIVTIKLIEPKIELTPAQCNPKIIKSTDNPLCPSVLNGGYKVQLVPEPPSIIKDINTKISAKGNNQKLIAFKRGNLISGALTIIGNNQFPKPPTKAGITIKKIIKIACKVIILL
jgi:hypothetical protein